MIKPGPDKLVLNLEHQSITAYEHCNAGFTNFVFPIGREQGCAFNPILFTLFNNELTSDNLDTC